MLVYVYVVALVLVAIVARNAIVRALPPSALREQIASMVFYLGALVVLAVVWVIRSFWLIVHKLPPN
jgi:hypothetical protein